MTFWANYSGNFTQRLKQNKGWQHSTFQASWHPSFPASWHPRLQAFKPHSFQASSPPSFLAFKPPGFPASKPLSLRASLLQRKKSQEQTPFTFTQLNQPKLFHRGSDQEKAIKNSLCVLRAFVYPVKYHFMVSRRRI